MEVNQKGQKEIKKEEIKKLNENNLKVILFFQEENLVKINSLSFWAYAIQSYYIFYERNLYRLDLRLSLRCCLVFLPPSKCGGISISKLIAVFFIISQSDTPKN